MFHEMRELARRAARSGSRICEVIDMASTRGAATQCAGDVTTGGPEGRDQLPQ
ncbi:hypothetical protein QFZ94_000227 [Paraburkholderia sp. JPY465]